MTPDHLDQHMRSRIYDYESEVPQDMWANIDRQLRPKRDRGGIFWWLSGLLLLLISGFIILNSRNSSLLTNLKNPPIVSSEIERSEGEVLTTLHPTDAAVKETAVSSISQDDKSSPELAEAPPISTDQKPIQVNDSWNADLSNKPSHGLASQVPPANESPTSKDLMQSPSILSEDANNTALTIINKNNILQSAATKIDKHKANPDRLAILSPLNLLEGKWSLLDDGRVDPLHNNCPSFSAKKVIRPFLEVELGAGYPIRELVARSAEAPDYRRLRNQSESVKNVFSLAGMIGVDIGQHVEIKLGGSFSQINEVFDLIDGDASRTEVRIIYDTLRDSNTDEILDIRSDTSIVTEYGRRIKLANNYFRIIDIPVMAGYRFKVRDQSFILQGGAAINLKMWREIDLLAPDESVVNADSGNPDAYPAFRSRMGVDLLAGIGYEVDISERNKLRILASMRYPLSSITQSDYPLTQQYTQVKLGVSWKHYLW